ncbi:MAG: polysaccharide biosynthesis tyrosine autokinase [Candidatus Saccharibacteria bacterium]|nr:polysaccharide biosynthesis tyrosine autokinase [Candidatus Saccharibacteria bacterium]
MEEIDIKDFMSYLKKFIIPMIVVAILATGASIFYNLAIKTPMYKTSTTVVLAQKSEDKATAITLNDISVSQKLVTTYSEIVKSKLVLEQVIVDLNLETSVEQLSKRVAVSAVEDTEIIRISVEDTNRIAAAQIANKIADVFTKKIVNIYQLNNVSVIDVAQVTDKQSNNTTARDAVIAFLISVFGISAIAFVIYYFDDTVKYSEDLERKVNLPVAGKIIKSEIEKRTIGDELLVDKYPKSIVSESIKSLRTNLQFSNVDDGFKTILITSANASEGKSFISSNLAISFAQANKKVLLVDCDLRKGRLHKLFNIPNLNGFSTLLTDEAINYKKYIQKTHIKNLDVITRGVYPPNPSELLGSQKCKDLLELLKAKYDIIIFDGAPCNGVTDSVVMSTLVDETLIVVKDAKTSKATLDATRESLQKVNAHITGIILNGVNRKVAKYYSYYGDK